jgi:hypothetical protein
LEKRCDTCSPAFAPPNAPVDARCIVFFDFLASERLMPTAVRAQSIRTGRSVAPRTFVLAIGKAMIVYCITLLRTYEMDRECSRDCDIGGRR